MFIIIYLIYIISCIIFIGTSGYILFRRDIFGSFLIGLGSSVAASPLYLYLFDPLYLYNTGFIGLLGLIGLFIIGFILYLLGFLENFDRNEKEQWVDDSTSSTGIVILDEVEEPFGDITRLEKIEDIEEYLTVLDNSCLNIDIKTSLYMKRELRIISELNKIGKFCFNQKCQKNISIGEVLNQSKKKGISLPSFIKQWESSIVQYYCCNCLKEEEEKVKTFRNNKLRNLTCPDCNLKLEVRSEILHASDDTEDEVLIFYCIKCPNEYYLDINVTLARVG